MEEKIDKDNWLVQCTAENCQDLSEFMMRIGGDLPVFVGNYYGKINGKIWGSSCKLIDDITIEKVVAFYKNSDKLIINELPISCYECHKGNKNINKIKK